ncbi:MAG: PKD domain-containing protein [Planctomycetota bacterium]
MSSTKRRRSNKSRKKATKNRANPRLSAAALETLESRKLLSGNVDVKINFQPNWAPVPSGYEVDSGKTYGNRGNGYTYGWNADLQGQGRDRNANSRQYLDTLIDTGNANQYQRWEMAVPNGTYFVKLVAGDSKYTGSLIDYDIEGKDFAYGRTRSGLNHIVGQSNTVEVTDGKLSLTAGSDLQAGRVNFIEVRQLSGGTSAPTPPSGGNNDGGSSGSDAPNGEGRVELLGNILRLTGVDGANNDIRIQDTGGNGFNAIINGQTRSYSESSIGRIEIFGGDGDDNLTVSTGINIPVRIFGNDGNDTIAGGERNDTLFGGAGNDDITGRGGNELIHGDAGADLIRAGNGDDRIVGYGENDSIYGENGNDWIDAGQGNDFADGGAGSDQIFGAESGPGDAGGSTPPPTPPAPSGGNDGGGNNGGGNSGGDAPVTPSAPSDGVKPTARINISDTNINVGQTVFVDALNSTLRAGTPLTARYEWDFGDSNGKYNNLVGFNAAHVYDRVGTYTLTLTVYNEDGGNHQVQQTIRVENAGRQVIYVAPWGNDNNSGTVERPIRSAEEVRRRLESRRDNVEVLFARGQTFQVYNTIFTYGTNIRFGSYGSGSEPRLRWDGQGGLGISIIRGDSSSRQVTIDGLAFDSRWTNPNERFNLPKAFMPGGKDATIKNSVFYNVEDAVNGNQRPDGVLVQDNREANNRSIRAYLVWAEGEDYTILGNQMSDSVFEHVIRVGGADRINVSYNDFDNPGKSVLNIQKGEYIYVHKNILRDTVSIGPLDGSDGIASDRWRWTVIDSNEFKGNILQIKHGAERTLVRNNIFRIDNGPAIEIHEYDNNFNRGVEDLTIVHNTGINNGDRGQFIYHIGPANGVKVLNNLYVAPGITVGPYASANIHSREASLNSFDYFRNNVWERMPGISFTQGGQIIAGYHGSQSAYLDATEWNARSITSGEVFADVSLDSQARPASGSAADNSARYFGGVYTDFYGNWRNTQSRDAGAVEN